MTPPQAGPIRLLIVDDHPIVRDGLVAIFTTQPDFEVVGTAGSGEDAIHMATETQPDVVLMDLEMPHLGGPQTIRILRDTHPQAKVVVFTAYDTDELILEAVRAGARGYLLKGAPREEIFEAVRVVSRSGSLLQPVIASRLLDHLRDDHRQPHPPHASASPPAPPLLTPRQLQVLTLLAHGLQNKEIAARLGITERTAKFHVRCIMDKLDASNRTEAVIAASTRGLIDLTP